jgi:Ni,Fe-hydrogenase III large subunit
MTVRTAPLLLAHTSGQWHIDVFDALERGGRFAGLFGTDVGDGCLVAVIVVGGPEVLRFGLHVPGEPGRPGSYPSLTPIVPAANWYERALHDLFGVRPVGHPDLTPLLLALPEGVRPPRPGAADPTEDLPVEDHLGASAMSGHGIFSLPYGPVRSGVGESMEFLIETPGEDVPHLTVRPHHKHRGIAKQFEGRPIEDGLLVAERVEGISSVAHALAFAHAVESLSEHEVPEPARLVRVVHAELERIANHLDVTMRLCEAAGLAVATSRFGWHKETVMRMVSHLSGSRFGRGVVRLGGVHERPRRPAAEVVDELRRLERRIRSDVAALESSASFLDRLRGTGPLGPGLARRHGALGPVGRASGLVDDARWARPTDAYPSCVPEAPVGRDAGDALARARVRWDEIAASVEMATTAIAALGTRPLAAADLTSVLDVPDGSAVGWSEAAQGETLYALTVEGGRVRRCLARSASLHNLAIFADTFQGDIFTDFAFIEASFGLGYAGAAL